MSEDKDKFEPEKPDNPSAHKKTMRDEFAMAALPALLSFFTQSDMYGSSGVERRRTAAVHAYAMADEMLERRQS